MYIYTYILNIRGYDVQHALYVDVFNQLKSFENQTND